VPFCDGSLGRRLRWLDEIDGNNTRSSARRIGSTRVEPIERETAVPASFLAGFGAGGGLSVDAFDYTCVSTNDRSDAQPIFVSYELADDE
jgi:hypothetical protein